jgi:DNA-binding HxlR family transcriptional regulator
MMGAAAFVRRGAVLALVSLLLLPVIAATADESETQLELIIEGLTVPQRGYFIDGDVISFDVVLSNSGSSAISTNTNPDCPASFQIMQSGVLFDSFIEEGCRNQTRGIEINAGESLVLDSFEYVLDNLGFGIFSIVGIAPSSGHSSSIDFTSQTQTDLFSNLSLEVIVAQTQSGDDINDELEAVEAIVRLVNLQDTTIQMEIDDNCRYQVVVENELNILSDLPCSGGHLSIPAFAVVEIGWLSLDGFSDGQHTLQVSLPAQDDFSASTLFTWVNNNQSAITGLEASILLNKEGNYGSGDSLVMTASVDNPSDSNVQLTFPSTCRAEIFIIDQDGVIVYDTRDIRDCPEVEVNHDITAGNSLQIQHSAWNFIDREGCELLTGDYRLIVDVPDYLIRGYNSLTYVSSGETLDCGADNSSSLDFTSFEQVNESSIEIAAAFTVEDVRWAQPCRMTIKLYDETFLLSKQVQSCGEEPGSRQLLSSDLIFEDLYLHMYNQQMEVLAEGTYRIDISTNSWPSAEASLHFEWPLEVIVEEVEESNEETEIEESVEGIVAHGSWQFITTEDGGCWLLTDTLGREAALSDSTAVGIQWQPSPELAGNYTIFYTEGAHHTCTDYASFFLFEIKDEYTVFQTTESTSIKEETPEVGIITEYGETIITSVVAVSFSAMLLAFVISHEGIRIPLTGISLGILGLIGRTHETNDGKFQRGRLMGYLTANPGCHFRALLSALEMSNGQLTHHIRVLEDEDRIWRRGDGRLVRFYPSAIPKATPEDELPIPPLSPDPNSLQGKILRLLDDDGQMGEYPTQFDLAIRLEKSQQLISHHLRTLQKFGLVEKKKFGVRNRYKLTREALFLLESSDL